MPLLSECPRFLTYEELRAELENYSYREGWSLSVFMDPWEGSCLYVVADVDNAYSTCVLFADPLHPGNQRRSPQAYSKYSALAE
jgi:hypothetical protein